MGSMQNNPKQKESRGSVNNKQRLAAFQPSGGKDKGNADWGNATPDWVAAVVRLATVRGIEVSFALSRDGGAHSFKMYDYGSGERVQLWFNGGANLDEELAKVYAGLEALTG